MELDSDVLPGLVMAGSLLVILVLVAMGKRKDRLNPDEEEDYREDSPPPPQGVPGRRSPALIILSFIVVLLMAATGVLGYLLWDLRQDFETAEVAFDRKVAEAEENLADITAAAIAEVPDVDEVQGDVDSLETALFGPGGPPMGQNNAIGDIRGDLAATANLMDDFATTFCVNDAFGRLARYSAEVAAHTGRIASGAFLVGPPPRLSIPRCF